MFYPGRPSWRARLTTDGRDSFGFYNAAIDLCGCVEASPALFCGESQVYSEQSCGTCGYQGMYIYLPGT